MRHARRFFVAFVLLAALHATATTAVAQVTSKFRVLLTEPFDPNSRRYDSEVIIENTSVKINATVYEFETPPLEPDRLYDYTFTANLQPNNYTVITRTRKVEFRAGEAVTVDFTVEHPDDRAKVRFVPTPDLVIEEMMNLAKVTKDDVVYEPGCGDARMTIAAVRAGAKRGVGIDIDPERVAEARAAVKEAGFEDRIEIRLGDALDIKDLSDATLVLLYMGDEFDMLIRPILWRQLRVGTRVVSHRFTMGDWEPDETRDAPAWEPEAQVHLWTITEAVKRRAEQETLQAVGQR